MRNKGAISSSHHANQDITPNIISINNLTVPLANLVLMYFRYSTLDPLCSLEGIYNMHAAPFSQLSLGKEVSYVGANLEAQSVFDWGLSH